MSSLNTTQSDLPQKEGKSEPSDTEIEESQTSSPAPQTEDSVPLKSKESMEKLAMTKQNSSNESKQTVESHLSHTQSMTLWQYLTLISKMFYIKFVVAPIARFKFRPRKMLAYPHRKLKRTCKAVDFHKDNKEQYNKVCKDLDRIVHLMFTTLSAQEWGMKLGIAAPQIGINKRVMIMRGRVCVNPEFTPTMAPTETVTESCYSLGKREFEVQRAKYGWAKWLDVTGVEHNEKVKGLEAIVFQHELNHLDGISCVDISREIKKL